MQVNVCSANPALTTEYEWDRPELKQESGARSFPWGWIALGILALVVISGSGSGGEK